METSIHDTDIISKKGSVILALPPSKTYTEDDYYNLPEHIRKELIDGQFYDMAAPNRIHQKILMHLSRVITNYIASKNGTCEVYPAPFAVKLFNDKKNDC